jgi:hypothetical protein
MAIAKKPKLNPVPASDEGRIQALINKGGSVAVREEEATAGLCRLQLRLDAGLISRVDAVRRNRLVAPSRHAWLLEAIHEKLQREEGKDA